MSGTLAVPRRYGVLRELLVFASFLLLTGAMLWPWPLHLREGVSDPGDPYLTSWILWWDWHGTFTQPLHLFDSNIFFPYRYSLAFSENCYGIALIFFPLFAAGVRPLTINGLATFMGFALSGYGAFRAARTLTGSAGAGWVAGIAFAFLPYRFHLLPHVVYVFAGWIPLLLEALVLFSRNRSRKRAVWLGVAFLMNGLSVLHWMVLTLLPLAATLIVLALRHRIERDAALWRRGAVALGAASLLLLPFYLPYRSAGKLYGFHRSADEATEYSAHAHDWLTADPAIRVWSDFGERPNIGERTLFPGLTLLILAALAFLLARPDSDASGVPDSGRHRRWIVFLDTCAFVAGTIALLSMSMSGFKLRVLGREVLTASSPHRGLAILGIALLVRCWLAWPAWLVLSKERNFIQSLRRPGRPEIVWVGAMWAALGLLGSFGMRTPFHRTLYQLFPLFRGIRVPARWAMIADLGLALLAGYGALLLFEKLRERRGFVLAGAVVFGGLTLAILWEDHIAPYDVWRGEVDPDDVTLRLKATPMKGGIVELPTESGRGNFLFVLRAADHARPLIDAYSGFTPPIPAELARLTRQRPIPAELLDLLESVPASYVVVRESWLTPDDRRALHVVLAKGLASGRLRFIRRFDGRSRNDLYAVVKTERGAISEMACPWRPVEAEPGGGPRGREDPELTGSVDEPLEGSAVRGALLVRGWARIPGQNLDVTVLLDGEVRDAISRRRPDRPDVASVLPYLGDCTGAGWEERYEFQPGDEGEHEIRVIFQARDGRIRQYPIRRFVWRP
jgi:hypothetical protein